MEDKNNYYKYRTLFFVSVYYFCIKMRNKNRLTACVTDINGDKNTKKIYESYSGNEQVVHIGRCKDDEWNGKTNTNTNQCIKLLPDLKYCQSNPFGLKCCETTHKLKTLGCFCNPSVKWILQGQYGITKNVLTPFCRVLNLDRDWSSPDCDELKTYNMACGIDDMELEKRRFESAALFSVPFQTAGENKCFDYEKIKDELKPYLADNPIATVPYGVGTYKGLDNMIEYLGIFWSGLNHGFWSPGEVSRESGSVEFSSDAKVVKLVGESDGAMWWTDDKGKDSCFKYDELPIGQDYSFEGCDTKIKNLTVVGDKNFAVLAQKFFETSTMFDKWGVEDICKTHDKYCTGMDKQYRDFDHCMEYLNSLPGISKKCAQNQKILAGDSQTCRFKHHFMVPLEPMTHCIHIGPQDGSNVNPIPPGMEHHTHKCNDTYECGSDDFSKSWVEMPGWVYNPDGSKKTLIPTKEAIDCAGPSNAAAVQWNKEGRWIGPNLCSQWSWHPAVVVLFIVVGLIILGLILGLRAALAG